jgi:hypothetical protein
MEVRDPPLRAHLLDAVTAWAALRYGARLKALPADHGTISRTSRDSEADSIVTLDILEGPAPLRVKVFVAPDGDFRGSD